MKTTREREVKIKEFKEDGKVTRYSFFDIDGKILFTFTDPEMTVNFITVALFKPLPYGY